MRGHSRSAARDDALLMAVLTAPEEPEAIASPRLAVPVLRLRCDGEPHERTVSLSTGKFTVGSSPQCQIHLPTADVRPLQCLIALEASAASVTRWAAGVQLNGRDFSKAALQDGDQLTIGSWEIEFDQDGDSPPNPQPSNDNRPGPPAVELSPEVEPQVPEQTAPLVIDPPATRPTAVAEPPASVDKSFAHEPTESGAHAFQDCLVLELWTANYQARRRAKNLINGIRAARFQVRCIYRWF